MADFSVLCKPECRTFVCLSPVCRVLLTWAVSRSCCLRKLAAAPHQVSSLITIVLVGDALSHFVFLFLLATTMNHFIKCLDESTESAFQPKIK